MTWVTEAIVMSTKQPRIRYIHDRTTQEAAESLLPPILIHVAADTEADYDEAVAGSSLDRQGYSKP